MPVSLSQALAASALAVFVYVFVLYVLALVRRDYSVIDRGWGPGILIAALAVIMMRPDVQLRQFVATLLVATWAFRLGAHVVLRSWGKGEDKRYAHLRGRWGEYGWFAAFFQVFVLQGLLMLVVALPLIIIDQYPGRPFGWLDFVGVAVWLFGFIWESTADHQLARFKQSPANAGRIMTSGLWRYSRHPNYFGEMVQWWGLWLMALSVPLGWLTVFGPLTVTFLLFKVSGVPMLEAVQRQNSEYREYARKTPTMFPRRPRK